MDNVRIAVLDAYDNVCIFLDNTIDEAMHYYKDELHTYLSGSAYTLSLIHIQMCIRDRATASNKQSTPLITFIEDKSNQAQSENEAVEPENEAVEPEKQKKDETKKSEPKNSASKK